jgi:hypothetical protein
MTALAWMAGVSLASWLAITAIDRDRLHPEVLFGMLGPLVSACGTWMAIRVAHRAGPARLTAVMVAGFALKMVFFGAYVAVMLRWLDLRAVPFVLSFTGYFIALYGMEALFLRRLTVAAPR